MAGDHSWTPRDSSLRFVPTGGRDKHDGRDRKRGCFGGVDGMLEPEDVAESVVVGLASESVLALPHPRVATSLRRKVDDYDRWLEGMRRLQDRFPKGI